MLKMYFIILKLALEYRYGILIGTYKQYTSYINGKYGRSLAGDSTRVIIGNSFVSIPSIACISTMSHLHCMLKWPLHSDCTSKLKIDYYVPLIRSILLSFVYSFYHKQADGKITQSLASCLFQYLNLIKIIRIL